MRRGSFVVRGSRKSDLYVTIFSAALILWATAAHAIEFPYKDVEDFEVLSDSQSLENFELGIANYIQACLDNTGGGTGALPCLIADRLWDRELNIYYNKLLGSLSSRDKQLLVESQRNWISQRDSSKKFQKSVLSKRYDQSGSMFMAMSANDNHDASTAITKARALWLKFWFEQLALSTSSHY